jgi:predicted phage baseplate assembly protein
MALKAPRLDDRSFADLVEEARSRIPLYTPEWTDHNASDPGITLIELFAFMSDIILYRLNRVPDKNYIKFMELIGMTLHEAVPAEVDVTFWLSAPQQNQMIIPADTPVATTRTETDEMVVFSTDGDLVIKPPELAYVMSSHAGDDGRVYKAFNIAGVRAGFEDIPLFASASPKEDDSFYFGFTEDLSNHLVGFNLTLDAAEGAGVNPNNPPYKWEVLDVKSGNRWVPVDIDSDTTLALNKTGLIRVHLPELTQSTINEVQAYWVRIRLEETDQEGNFYEVSPRLKQVTSASWGGTVGATNVTRVREEVMGRSDGSPGQVFYMEHKPVAARTNTEYMYVKLQDGREQRWMEVSDFATSRANDRHYTIDSDTGVVRLGPALPQPDGTVRRYGALPPKGAMIIMKSYRHGGGQQGNVGRGSITVLQSPIPYVERVLNRSSASGGRDAETLENAKLRVPGHLRSLQRAVTPGDFEYLTEQAAPGQVGRVYCLQPPLTQRGENKVLVIPSVPVLKGYISPESLELSTDTRDIIEAYLDERRLLSTRLEVTTPVYQWVETEVTISTTRHYDFEKVRQAVEARLFEFLNPLIGGMDGKGWPFGRDLLVADVMAALSAVEGVNFVRQVRLFPISYEGRQFRRAADAVEVSVPSDGVIVSYQHTVIPG